MSISISSSNGTRNQNQINLSNQINITMYNLLYCITLDLGILQRRYKVGIKSIASGGGVISPGLATSNLSTFTDACLPASKKHHVTLESEGTWHWAQRVSETSRNLFRLQKTHKINETSSSSSIAFPKCMAGLVLCTSESWRPCTPWQLAWERPLWMHLQSCLWAQCDTSVICLFKTQTRYIFFVWVWDDIRYFNVFQFKGFPLYIRSLLPFVSQLPDSWRKVDQSALDMSFTAPQTDMTLLRLYSLWKIERCCFITKPPPWSVVMAKSQSSESRLAIPSNRLPCFFRHCRDHHPFSSQSLPCLNNHQSAQWIQCIVVPGDDPCQVLRAPEGNTKLSTALGHIQREAMKVTRKVHTVGVQGQNLWWLDLKSGPPRRKGLFLDDSQ